MAMDDRNAGAAQKHFSAAAALNSDQPVNFYGLALGAICAGDLQVAAKAWQRATQCAPKNFDELTACAAIEQQKGQVDAAHLYA